MSDVVQIVTLLCALVSTCFTAYLTYRLALLSSRIRDTQGAVVKVAHEMNSMKDALVKATGDASFAEGRETGRAEGK